LKKVTPCPAIEEDDRYVIPLKGRSVSRCYVDFAFGLLFHEDGPRTEVRIEGKMRLISSEKEIVAEPADVASLGPFVALFGQSVTESAAFKNGTLRIQFAHGLQLEAEPLERFESWAVTADDGLRIVSLPGGSLAFWQSTAEP